MEDCTETGQGDQAGLKMDHLERKEHIKQLKGLRQQRLADQGLRNNQAIHRRTERHRRRKAKKHDPSKEQIVEDNWDLIYDLKWILYDEWQSYMSDSENDGEWEFQFNLNPYVTRV